MQSDLQVPPPHDTNLPRSAKVAIAFLATWIAFLAMGFGFLFIFIGVYGLLVLASPYTPPLQRAVERFLGASPQPLHRPLPGTPWQIAARSAILVFLRLILIVLGAFLVLRLGFRCQNLIWIIAAGGC